MDINQLIESFRDDIIKHTQELIKIKSIEGNRAPGKPFGEEVNRALEYMLKLSKEMGFDTLNLDGYAGHAEIGEGEKTLGILVHLDVVPEGDGWNYPPFGGEVHNGKIFGRGASDDKGPAIAALFAMKAVEESNLPLKKKVRIIFGTNEETNWNCMKHYFSRIKAPDMAFTPDSDFPVIFAEKGILVLSLTKKLENKCKGNIEVIDISGGNRPNMVPDSCKAVLKMADDYVDAFIEKYEEYKLNTNAKLSIDINTNNITIYSKGISAHGSNPQSGSNAISQLMSFLTSVIDGDCDLCSFIKTYDRKLGKEVNGESLGCGFEDDVTGKLTLNVGMIQINPNEARVTLDIRYPVKITSEEVCKGIEDSLRGTGIDIVEVDHMKPLYVPKDHPLVETLMKVYKDETGDTTSQPITTGGGTYARSMKNAVAFGPAFPGQIDVAHQNDEYISIEHLIKITRIYAKAIYELAR